MKFKLKILNIQNDYVKIIPFSTEKLSLGKPDMFHDRIFTASPRVCANEKFLDRGIDLDSTYLLHSITCSFIKKELKNLKIN